MGTFPCLSASLSAFHGSSACPPSLLGILHAAGPMRNLRTHTSRKWTAGCTLHFLPFNATWFACPLGMLPIWILTFPQAWFLVQSLQPALVSVTQSKLHLLPGSFSCPLCHSVISPSSASTSSSLSWIASS